MAIELGTLPQTPTAQLVTAGFTCKETPIREVDDNGSEVGRKRECTKDGSPPTSGAAPKEVGDAELTYSDEVKTTFRKTAGVERHTTADISWKGVAHIAGIDWDVTVADVGANGTIDEFVLLKPTEKGRYEPARYTFVDDGRMNNHWCWKLAPNSDFNPGVDVECTRGVYEAVDDAYQAALVRLGLKNPPKPEPAQGRNRRR